MDGNDSQLTPILDMINDSDGLLLTQQPPTASQPSQEETDTVVPSVAGSELEDNEHKLTPASNRSPSKSPDHTAREDDKIRDQNDSGGDDDDMKWSPPPVVLSQSLFTINDDDDDDDDRSGGATVIQRLNFTADGNDDEKSNMNISSPPATSAGDGSDSSGEQLDEADNEEDDEEEGQQSSTSDSADDVIAMRDGDEQLDVGVVGVVGGVGVGSGSMRNPIIVNTQTNDNENNDDFESDYEKERDEDDDPYQNDEEKNYGTNHSGLLTAESHDEVSDEDDFGDEIPPLVGGLHRLTGHHRQDDKVVAMFWVWIFIVMISVSLMFELSIVENLPCGILGTLILESGLTLEKMKVRVRAI